MRKRDRSGGGGIWRKRVRERKRERKRHKMRQIGGDKARNRGRRRV